MIFLRLAWREARNNWRFSLFFILNLFLGLSGFIALDAFQKAMHETLQQESRAILGADFAVYARRPLNPDETTVLNAALQASTKEGATLESTAMVELYSMAAFKNASRLVQIKAIEPQFPFYGEITLRHGGKLGAGSGAHLTGAVAWVYPEILQQLQVAVGDSIQLGQTTFRIADIVEKDPSATALGVSLAPRVFIGLPQLPATGLIAYGTTAFFHRLFKVSDEQVAKNLAQTLHQAFTDPGVRVESHDQAGEDLARLSGLVGDFLGLVALVAYCLATLGCGFLFFTFLNRRLKEIAILMSLGATPQQARTTYFIQLCILGSISALPTLLAALLIFPWLNFLNQKFFPLDLKLQINGVSMLLAVAFGALGSILIGIPILGRLKNLKPSVLLAENIFFEKIASPWRSVFWMLPGLGVFWLLSVWQSNSWVNGSYFFLGVLLSSAGLLFLGWLFLLGVEGLSQRFHSRNIAWRLALRHLYRNRLASLSCFLALGLGSLLLNLIPQMRETLAMEFERPDQAKLPSLFLFDIQEDQRADLAQQLASFGLNLDQASPLIRARLDRVNGKEFVKADLEKPLTREEEREQRFRNRGFNLTYREQLADSESIVEGKPFALGGEDAGKSPLAQISLEKRFAKRLNLNLNDILTFDVQGVAVEGQVVNLRKVRWSSFQPNFFVVFEPGFLEEAPKTFLASLPPLSTEMRGRVQQKLVRHFPNVSIIDVSRVVDSTVSLIGHIAQAITFMAFLSIVAGLVVLFSITSLQAYARRYDFNLLKILGGGFGDLTGIFLYEAGLLLCAAGVLGGLFGLGFSFILSKILFEGLWVFNPWVPVRTTALMLLLGLGVAYLAVRGVLRNKPIDLLSAR